MRYRRIVMGALAIVLFVGAAGALTGFRRQAAAGTTGGIDPAAFTNPVANPYFPLKVGTVLHYLGSDGGQRFRERLTITHWRKKIQGVTTTVVLDVLRRADDNTIAEKTWDWYADDNAGNAWYFGEKTATYTRTGNVISRDGSWQAGIHGAVAGNDHARQPAPHRRVAAGVPRRACRGSSLDRPADRARERAAPAPGPRGAQLRVDAARTRRAVAEVLRARPGDRAGA
jgi:hypothetical protein